MDIQTQINQVAVGCFAEAMRLTDASQGRNAYEQFKVLLTMTVNGEPKTLLIFGKVYPYYGDGFCYGVLNPSAMVLECLDPSLAYDKSAFVGECDLMSQQWVNTNGESPRAAEGLSYTARKRKPTRTAMV
jgi:hypothetical protein